MCRWVVDGHEVVAVAIRAADVTQVRPRFIDSIQVRDQCCRRWALPCSLLDIKCRDEGEYVYELQVLFTSLIEERYFYITVKDLDGLLGDDMSCGTVDLT